MESYSYINGKIVPSNEARVSVYDLGFLRGYGVFDFLRTEKGKPLYLEQHLDRLERSVQEVSLNMPLSREDIKDIISILLRKNNFKESVFRIIITGGEMESDFKGKKPSVFVLHNKFVPLPEDYYKKGVKVLTREYQRTFPVSKTLDYLVGASEQPKAEREGVFEIVFVKDGLVLEARTSNIFIIKSRKVITPKNNILLGITREKVINTIKKEFEIEERNIELKELISADEVFLTATNKNVLPVVNVDGENIGNGKVGNITKRIMKLYKESLS